MQDMGKQTHTNVAATVQANSQLRAAGWSMLVVSKLGEGSFGVAWKAKVLEPAPGQEAVLPKLPRNENGELWVVVKDISCQGTASSRTLAARPPLTRRPYRLGRA